MNPYIPALLSVLILLAMTVHYVWRLVGTEMVISRMARLLVFYVGLLAVDTFLLIKVAHVINESETSIVPLAGYVVMTALLFGGFYGIDKICNYAGSWEIYYPRKKMVK